MLVKKKFLFSNLFFKFGGLARWTLLVWLLAAVLAYRYFINIPSLNLQQYLYLALIEIGHFGLLSLILSLPLYLLSIFLSARIFIFIASIFFAFILNLLFVDTVVFALYKFHLSWFLVDLLRYGGNDLINFSKTMWVIAIGIQLLFFAIVFALGRYAYISKFLSIGKLLLIYVIIITSAFAYNIWHAWDDANNNPTTQIFKANIPIYYPLTAKRYFKSKGWVDYSKTNKTEFPKFQNLTKYKNFNYPLEPLKFGENAKNYNILVVLVDALRSDVFSKKYTPNAFSLAKLNGAWRGHNHLAGANATKAGVFALFYSLPSQSYYDLAKSTSPVLMQKMIQNSYDFKILSSANLISPSFASNVFSNIDGVRIETPGSTPNDRDKRITQDWLEFISKRQENKADKPFFGFLFYDSVHAYQAPADFPKYQPYQDNINYLSLDNEYDVTPYFNKYRTAVKYTDTLVGKVLDDLKNRGLLKNTVVIFSADHGEEFNDNKQNYWGHTGNFSYAQTKVPFVIYLPDTKGGNIFERTSHYDLAPTLMEEVFDCKSPLKNYSFGNNLFKEKEVEYVMAGSYVNDAIMLKDTLLVFNNDGTYKIYDYYMKKTNKEIERKTLQEASKAQMQVGRFLH